MRHYLVMAAGFGIAMIASTPVAMAGGDSWGSVAYSPSTHAFGYSHNFRTEDGAADRALSACRSQRGGGDCETAVDFDNACGAVFAGSNGGWGKAWDAHGEERAQARALRACQGHSDDCELVISHCSPNRSEEAD